MLPLLPVIIRLVYQLALAVHCYFATDREQKKQPHRIQREATSLSNSQAQSSSSSASLTSNASDLDPSLSLDAHAQATRRKMIATTARRLVFYFLVLNFRGWGLYIGANALEDYALLPLLTGNTVVSPMRTNSMSDVEHDLHYSGKEPECWYKDVLKAHHKSAMDNDGHSECYGRPFDFSDHVVLFLAHYLPVFVMEMLLCYSIPFWDSTQKAAQRGHPVLKYLWTALHVFLLLYLHLLVLHALYQTAVYFHTPAEILVGYVVSLILQLPVMHLMCADTTQSLKEYIGLPTSESVRISEKGD